MINKILIFLISSIFSTHLLAADVRLLKNKSKSVLVEVELEKADAVIEYEIEIRDQKAKTGKSFKQSEPVFSIPLEVGNYFMRTRMKSSSEKSPWTEWISLLAPPNMTTLNPAQSNFILNKTDRASKIDLSWNPAVGADRFRVWIEKVDQDTKKNIIKKFETKNLSFLAKLPTGDYKIGVQSLAKTDIASEVVYFPQDFKIRNNVLQKIVVKNVDYRFNWDKQPDTSVKIEVYFKPFFSEKFQKNLDIIVDSLEWTMPIENPPGHYRFDFQYISELAKGGPVHSIEILKRPKANDFRAASSYN